LTWVQHAKSAKEAFEKARKLDPQAQLTVKKIGEGKYLVVTSYKHIGKVPAEKVVHTYSETPIKTTPKPKVKEVKPEPVKEEKPKESAKPKEAFPKEIGLESPEERLKRISAERDVWYDIYGRGYSIAKEKQPGVVYEVIGGKKVPVSQLVVKRKGPYKAKYQYEPYFKARKEEFEAKKWKKEWLLKQHYERVLGLTPEEKKEFEAPTPLGKDILMPMVQRVEKMKGPEKQFAELGVGAVLAVGGIAEVPARLLRPSTQKVVYRTITSPFALSYTAGQLIKGTITEAKEHPARFVSSLVTYELSFKSMGKLYEVGRPLVEKLGEKIVSYEPRMMKGMAGTVKKRKTKAKLKFKFKPKNVEKLEKLYEKLPLHERIELELYLKSKMKPFEPKIEKVILNKKTGEIILKVKISPKKYETRVLHPSLTSKETIMAQIKTAKSQGAKFGVMKNGKFVEMKPRDTRIYLASYGYPPIYPPSGKIKITDITGIKEGIMTGIKEGELIGGKIKITDITGIKGEQKIRTGIKVTPSLTSIQKGRQALVSGIASSQKQLSAITQASSLSQKQLSSQSSALISAMALSSKQASSLIQTPKVLQKQMAKTFFKSTFPEIRAPIEPLMRVPKPPKPPRMPRKFSIPLDFPEIKIKSRMPKRILSIMKTTYKPSLGGIVSGKTITKIPKGKFTGLEIRFPKKKKGKKKGITIDDLI